MILHPPDLTKRQMRRARREHGGLRAIYSKARWWQVAQGYYDVSCSCGWSDPERIPFYPETGQLLADILIDKSMRDHLEATCR